jgi:hypothetical protein
VAKGFRIFTIVCGFVGDLFPRSNRVRVAIKSGEGCFPERSADIGVEPCPQRPRKSNRYFFFTQMDAFHAAHFLN